MPARYLSLLVFFVGLLVVSPRALSEEPARSVVLIAGPGGAAYGKAQIQDLYSSLTLIYGSDSVNQVGDGENAIFMESAVATVQRALKSGKRPIVIIVSHAFNDNGDFEFGPDDIVSADVLFGHFAAVSKGAPIDILSTLCFGGRCGIEARRRLPRGSLFISLAPKDEGASFLDVKRLIAALKIAAQQGVKNMAPQDLLYLYLFEALEHPTSPHVAVGQGGEQTALDLLSEMVGHGINANELLALHNSFDRVIGSEQVEAYARAIGSLDSAEQISRYDIGKAYALALELTHALPPPSDLMPHVDAPAGIRLRDSCSMLTGAP